MKPRFITKWYDGRLVPVRVDGASDVEYAIDHRGRPSVAIAWWRGELIYRDPASFKLGPR